jgi:hypothetical protein
MHQAAENTGRESKALQTRAPATPEGKLEQQENSDPAKIKNEKE